MEIRMKNGHQIPVSTMDGTGGELSVPTKARKKDTCHVHDSRQMDLTLAQKGSEEKTSERFTDTSHSLGCC
jgi:hypothetical protein